MTNFDNVLGSISRGGPGAIRYDGDSLTNEGEMRERIAMAELLEQIAAEPFPDDIGSGAAIAAAEEKMSELGGDLLKIADALRAVGEAGLAAAPVIRGGTAADPEVQGALERLSAVCTSATEGLPDEGDTDSKVSGRDEGIFRSPRDLRPRDEWDDTIVGGGGDDTIVGGGVTTGVSADHHGPMVQATPLTAPTAPAPPMAPTAPAPMAPGPTMTPSALGGVQPQPQRRRRDDSGTPTTPWFGDGGGGVVGGVVAPTAPAANPSVTGGRVDPAQISGRTASTSPSAGLPPLKTGPAGSTGMMGGMGGMPMGAGGLGNGGGAARPDMPQPRRDRDSERILTGEEARDKALVSHILRDDDPPASEYIDSTELADLLPDERHPIQPAIDESVLVPGPVVMNVPPPAPPQLPRMVSFDSGEPIQYPGEPRDDEKW